MNNNFFGSKLNTVLLLVLIVVMAIAIMLMLQNPGAYFPIFGKQIIKESQAKEIAKPIIEKCWKTDNISVVSFSASVVKGKYGEEEHKSVWRVGGNYNDGTFGYIENDSPSTAPEVYLDAYTGEVVEKHFQDLGAHPIAECNNN